jgi:peptidyl-prolyl cis-trans isomerase C
MNEVAVVHEAESTPWSSRLRRSLPPVVMRWLREPLLHFLLLGGLLFAAYAYVEPRVGAATDVSWQIRLTPDELLQLATYSESQWRRPPTLEEFSRLVEDKVRQEVLYREALAMGLDKDDEIVKRRMAQKMQFLAEDVAAAREPTTAELKSFYEQNGAQFAQPNRVSFRHLYFSPDRRGGHARDDAATGLAQLAGQPQDARIAGSLADPFMFQDYYRDRVPEHLRKDFGPRFALAIEKLVPGSWQGPIESGFGWHLVFVDTLIPGRVPPFEEVETDVKAVWLAEQKATAWDRAFKEMRAKYTVLLPALPESASGSQAGAPASGNGSAPAARGAR